MIDTHRAPESHCQLRVLQANVGGVRCDVVLVSHVARHFAPHFFESYAFTVIDTGVCQVKTARTARTAGPGELIALAPEEVNQVEVMSREPLTYRTVYLPPELIAGLAPRGVPRGSPADLAAVIGSSKWSKELGSNIDAVIDDPDGPDAGNALIENVVKLLRESEQGRSTPRVTADLELVGAAREYLRASIGRRVYLGDLARTLGVSTFHLIKTFRRVTGVSPYAYLILLRVNRARSMLDAGLPITEAAFSCGFSDQSHLTRTFRRAFGTPPGRYARAVVPQVPLARQR